MRFPVYLGFGPVSLHPHWVFEALAYLLSFYWYRRQRRRQGDPVDARTRSWVLGAAVVGGLIGNRLLYLIEDPVALAADWTDPTFLLGGKTIVGGLIGGLIAVEWIKRRRRVATATGDLLVLPLLLGIAVGRIGCFLTGLPDRTHGIETGLPWGVDYGDGIIRHPTQLYEVAFLALLFVLMLRLAGRLSVAGDQFKLFMLAYMTFRLAVEFIKPVVGIGGVSAIQWACLATLAYYAPHVPRLVAGVRRG
jgi:phosphatidylglycerol---prolipoprotein diacylglyceryl transferase